MAKNKSNADSPTKKQIQEWKQKAENWDNLYDEIAKFYTEPQEVEGDLGDIGEIAALHLGFL